MYTVGGVQCGDAGPGRPGLCRSAVLGQGAAEPGRTADGHPARPGVASRV